MLGKLFGALFNPSTTKNISSRDTTRRIKHTAVKTKQQLLQEAYKSGMYLEPQSRFWWPDCQTIDELSSRIDLHLTDWGFTKKINSIIYKKEIEEIEKVSQSDTDAIIYCIDCGHAFLKHPKAKTRCKACGSYVWKRDITCWKDVADGYQVKIWVNEKGKLLYEQLDEKCVYLTSLKLYQYLGNGDVNAMLYYWLNQYLVETNNRQIDVWELCKYIRTQFFKHFRYYEYLLSIERFMVDVAIKFGKYDEAMSYLVSCLCITHDAIKINHEEWAKGSEVVKIFYDYLDIEEKLGEKETKRMYNTKIIQARKNGRNTKLFREIKSNFENVVEKKRLERAS